MKYLLLFLILVIPVFARANPPLPPSPALFKNLVNQHKNITRLEASFEQEKRFAFLKKPLISKGMLYFEQKARPTLVFGYTTPIATGIVCQGAECTMWSATTTHTPSKEEQLMLQKMRSTLLPWLTFDETALLRTFTITEETPLCLKFTPTKKNTSPTFTLCTDQNKIISTLCFSQDTEITKLSFTKVLQNGPKRSTLPNGVLLSE